MSKYHDRSSAKKLLRMRESKVSRFLEHFIVEQFLTVICCQVNKLAVSPNGMIAIPQDNRHVSIFDIAGGKVTVAIFIPTYIINGVPI